MNKTEKIFADGFMFKMQPDSPDWVVGNLSLKAEEAIAFIQKNSERGWVNLKVNIGKSGKPYVELDTWKPKEKEGHQTPAADFTSGDKLPF